MQAEQDWNTRADAEDADGAAERYQFFMRPEPKEGLGPIEIINDPYLGPTTQVRTMRVGMVRNAADENKKEVLVYLKPFPHIRLDAAKPLQGWYQSKVNESKQSRPRPCLLPGTLVDTPSGPVPIEMLNKGDAVMGMDLETGIIFPVLIEETTTQIKEEYLELELENGKRLLITPEHQVYTLNRGWVEAVTLTPEDELCPLFAESMA